jgi:phage terminase large subunit
MNEQATTVEWKETGVLEKIADVADKRIICLYGGSSSSKTISALQYLTTWCLEYPEPLVVSIIGESIPVLKKSVIRDWQRLVMRGMFDRKKYNKLELTYSFDNGSIIQFIPADDEGRFLGPRHDFVLIDEAYNVPKGIFDQIEIRTRRQILLTWNPVSPFWATRLEDERDDVAVIHATYHDNPFVEQAIIDSLERRATTDPNFYDVYVLGKYGSIEGLIFERGRHWVKCDALPPGDERKRTLYVVDFGFTHDPTFIGELVYSNGEFWIDELEYKPGMFNTEIHDVIKLNELPDDKKEADGEPLTHEDLKKVKTRTEVVADSAEPKSIAEMKQLGLNVIASVKGPDSIKYGINIMKEFRINVTKQSLNIIKEFRNYSWQKDRHGEFTETPVDNWNHAVDGIRYGVTHVRRKPNFGKYAVS